MKLRPLPLSCRLGRRLLCRKTDAGQELVLKLSGPEKSDYLNFVIKDDSTGRW